MPRFRGVYEEKAVPRQNSIKNEIGIYVYIAEIFGYELQ
jgi:hypothetical protein